MIGIRRVGGARGGDMESSAQLVDLGFAEAKLPLGTHICQIYSEEIERRSSLEQFLLRGLKRGESCACFSDKTDAERLAEPFAEHGVSVRDALDDGSLTLTAARGVYLDRGSFNPERLLALLQQFHSAAVASGRVGGRVIGEMISDIRQQEGGDRLLEYESRVTMLLRDNPLTAVCQYDARTFDGSTLMDVLKVHPMMVVRGTVVQNPFYLPPEEILG